MQPIYGDIFFFKEKNTKPYIAKKFKGHNCQCY